MTAVLEGGEWSAASPGRTLPPGKTRYPFYRRLGETHGRSGRAKNLVPTGIRPRTVQPVVSRYIDWATGPTSITSFHIFWRYTHLFRAQHRPFGLQEVDALRFYRQLTYEGSKDVSPRHRLPLRTHPSKYSWYSFLLEAESTPRTLWGRKEPVSEEVQRPHEESSPLPFSV
jgi:hypothetical protein